MKICQKFSHKTACRCSCCCSLVYVCGRRNCPDGRETTKSPTSRYCLCCPNCRNCPMSQTSRNCQSFRNCPNCRSCSRFLYVRCVRSLQTKRARVRGSRVRSFSNRRVRVHASEARAGAGPARPRTTGSGKLGEGRSLGRALRGPRPIQFQSTTRRRCRRRGFRLRYGGMDGCKNCSCCH